MDYLRRNMPDDSTLRSGREIFFSYLLDYIVIVILFGAISALNFATPFMQHFALQNYTLQYPYAVHERVPLWLLYTCAVIAPAVIVAVYTLVIDPLVERRRDRTAGRAEAGFTRSAFWQLNSAILSLLLANTAAYVITGILKNAIGKPRPDLIDRCQPKVPQDDFVSPVFGLSNVTICSQTDMKMLHDGFRSFPSGHSSSSFAGLFFLSLFLAGKLHFLDHRGSVWKVFVVLIPTLGAALIAGSRIMDARHHPFDVITGSLLGILCAFVAYRQYFPAISSTDMLGRAYTVRRHAKAIRQRDHSTEPLRPSHRPNPSFTLRPPAEDDLFETENDEADQHFRHSQESTGRAYSAVPNGGSPKRTRSQALSSEPLRQRAISNPTNARTSLGPELGLNNSTAAFIQQQPQQQSPRPSPTNPHQYSPSLGAVSQNDSNSMFGRPSAEGPLGSENHTTSRTWQPGSPHNNNSHAGFAIANIDTSGSYRGTASGDIPTAGGGGVGGGEALNIEALRRREFPGSPTFDGPSTPVEMDPMPMPIPISSPTMAHVAQHTAQHAHDTNTQQAPSYQQTHQQTHPNPLHLHLADLIRHEDVERGVERGAGAGAGAVDEGGETLIHPAFRTRS